MDEGPALERICFTSSLGGWGHCSLAMTTSVMAVVAAMETLLASVCTANVISSIL